MRTEIIGWNPINVDGYENPQVSLYIKPTLDLLKLFNRAVNNRVLILVHGSGSCYDGKKIFATIDKSSDVPNCRQNFFNCTGLYVITLDHIWFGYPLENGEIQFLDGVVNKLINYVQDDSKSVDELDKILEEPVIEEKPLKKNQDIQINYNDIQDPTMRNVSNKKTVEKTSKGFTNTILIVIGIAFLAILIFSLRKKQ